MLNKSIKEIISILLRILDKREPNFIHKFTYVSINEIPEEEKVGRLRVYDGDMWVDKAVWIGVKNQYYHDVMKIIGEEEVNQL